MKRVLTAVILIPLVVLALFKAPLWLFTILVFGVAVLALREYLDIAQGTGLRPFRRWCYGLLACLFYFFLWQLSQEYLPFGKAFTIGFALRAVAPLLVLASPFLLMAIALRRDPLSQALPDAAVSFLFLPYIGLTLICLPILRSYPNGAMYVLFLLVIVWAGDIAAYYVGRAVGKRKLAPRVSPGKTWEGTIASGAGAVLVAFLLFHFAPQIYFGLTRARLLAAPWSVLYGPVDTRPQLMPAPAWLVALFALCVNVAAQLGDLVESAIKRGAGMKDSGALLPGHGGVLDRIDALLFALPVGQLFFASGMVLYFQPGGIR